MSQRSARQKSSTACTGASCACASCARRCDWCTSADVGVGQVGHLRERLRGELQALQLALLEQRAQPLQAKLDGVEAFAVQAVAGLQVVVEEGQRRAHGEGVQPQRGLGQLHGHGVLVHAEDALFEDHAAHDVPVVELRFIERPAVRGGVGADAAADVRQAREHGALPRAALLHQVRRPGLRGDAQARGGAGFERAVGQVIDQRDQKVPAAHGRVTNLALEQRAGRVELVEQLPFGGVEGAFFAPLLQLLFERLHALGGQKAHGFAQHQVHQLVVRVVAARDLARKARGQRHEAIGRGLVLVAALRRHLVHQGVFEQALVDAAQVRHRQVAVVDPALEHFFGAARERVDDGRHDLVGHLGALEQRRARAVE